jgi:hypothetical protein
MAATAISRSCSNSIGYLETSGLADFTQETAVRDPHRTSGDPSSDHASCDADVCVCDVKSVFLDVVQAVAGVDASNWFSVPG